MKRDYPEHNPDWLRTEHYAKLSKKENPHGLGCTLCEKTHSSKLCPNKKTIEKTSKPKADDYSTLYSSYENEGNGYGW